MSLVIRPAIPSDEMSISVVVSTAFHRPDEAKLVQALRAAGAIALELVATLEGDDQIHGHIAFSRLELPTNWLALAPLSVTPDFQGQGIGGTLICEGLEAARKLDHDAVLVVGDPEYYARFGFSKMSAQNLDSPFPKMFTSLYPIAAGSGLLGAKVVYPPAFDILAR